MLRSIFNNISEPIGVPLDSSDDVEIAECFYTEFDGVGDSFDTADSSMQLSGAQTLAFKFKRTSTDDGIIGNVDLVSPWTGYGLLVGSSKLRLELNGAGDLGGNLSVNGTTVLSDSDWYQVIFKRDASTTNEVYLDGVLEISGTKDLVLPTENFFIGRIGPSYTTNLEGSLRDIEFFNAEASTPASYVFNDPSSIGLIESNAILRSADGGTTIDKGPSFSTTGDPTRGDCS